jgi:hypothetical protein
MGGGNGVRMTPRGASSKTQLQVWEALIGVQGGEYPRQEKEDWLFFCPGHEDGKKSGKRSLSVKFEDDGSTKAYCFACGSGKTFYDTLSQTLSIPREVFDGDRLQVKEKTQEEKKTWVYLDGKGQPYYRVRRYDKAGGKIFGQDFWDGSKWVKIKEWEGKKPSLVLYNLPSLKGAIQERKTVYVVEGEKCADALTSLGLISTTNPLGANKWQPHYSSLLGGAEVVILPDNDTPGKQHAEGVAKSLEGVAKSVKILPLPGLEEKEDVYDWFQKGHTVKDLSSLAVETLTPLPKVSRFEKPSMVKTRPPKPWLLENLVGERDFVMVYGQPGAGKSFVALDLAVSLCLGRSFAGRFPAVQGPKKVLYCASEDYSWRAERLGAGVRKYGSTEEHLDGFLTFLEAVPNLFLATGENSTGDFIQEVIDEGLKVDLIIIDTLADALAGAEENSASDASTVNSNIKRIRETLQCAVLVVHHTGKNGESERGSSAYRAKADGMFKVSPVGQSSGVMALTKFKGRVTVPEVAFNLENPLGDGFSAQVIWQGEAGYSADWTQEEKDLLEVVREAGPLSRSALAEALGLASPQAAHSKAERLISAGMVKTYRKDMEKPASKTNPYFYDLVDKESATYNPITRLVRLPERGKT